MLKELKENNYEPFVSPKSDIFSKVEMAGGIKLDLPFIVVVFFCL